MYFKVIIIFKPYYFYSNNIKTHKKNVSLSFHVDEQPSVPYVDCDNNSFADSKSYWRSLHAELLTCTF